MNKKNSKNNQSSMQVIKTLQVLMQGNYTMQELVNTLNSKEQNPIFNNSVVSKYINTCRYCGIEIPKIHNQYFIAKLPFGINFSTKEIDLLQTIQNFLYEECSRKYINIFQKFIQKINKFAEKTITELEQNYTNKSFEQFENAVTERRMVKLFLDNHISIVCIPLKVSIKNDKTYFNIFYKNRERLINTKKIINIEVLHEKFIKGFNNQTVVFKLTGNLAKNYTLREHENILSKDNDSITISCSGEDRENLFARLLRYDDKCEILTPKDYRLAMKQIIEEALLNYGE